MCTIQFETESVRIPLWVTDLSSYRRWADSAESPDKVTVCYLSGEVWVEMSKERVYSHNQVKTEFARVLAGLVGWSTAVASGSISTSSAIRPAAIPRRASQRAGWSPPCSVTRC